MSLGVLFDIGKTALFTSQKALTIAGNNIANVNTPNYTKQDVILEPSMPIYVRGDALGRGVNYLGVRRVYDRFIQAQMFKQSQNYGRSDVLSTLFGHLEQIFNEAQEAPLSSAISDFSAAWQEVSTNPASIPSRTLLLGKAQNVVSSAKNMESRILTEMNNGKKEIEDIVTRINDLLEKIRQLNENIIQSEAGKSVSQANELRDMRDSALKELSGLVTISIFEDNQGAVNVTIGGMSVVRSAIADKLSLSTDQYGEMHIYKGNIEITNRIITGKLGGLLDGLTTIKEETLSQLRKMIGAITNEINKFHRQGYGLDGSTGNNFFTSLSLSSRDNSLNADITSLSISDYNQLKPTEYTISFDNSNNYYVTDKFTNNIVTSGNFVSGNPIVFDGLNLTITGTVTSLDSFKISTIEDSISHLDLAITGPKDVAAAVDSNALPGDNRNAISISKVFSEPLSSLNMTYSDYYRNIVTSIGTLASNANDANNFDLNLLREIENSREGVSGVSLDEEAVNIIRYQRGFEAAAKMITVADELLQTLLRM